MMKQEGLKGQYFDEVTLGYERLIRKELQIRLARNLPNHRTNNSRKSRPGDRRLLYLEILAMAEVDHLPKGQTGLHGARAYLQEIRR
jgi:hypothetical protein